MVIDLIFSLPKIIGIELVDDSFLDLCVLLAFLIDDPREGENG